jgi:hypothetical protein
MATGTATCPYCAGDRELVMAGRHVVSGPLVTDHTELLRHRDESSDAIVHLGQPDDEDYEENTATRPRLVEVEVEGVKTLQPGGLRPIFKHLCPSTKQAVTLYADTEGGSVQ